jgi:hypothetical protein
MVEEKATAAGLTPTEWARQATLERDPPPRRAVPELNQKAWLELARLAVTLNGAMWRFPTRSGGRTEDAFRRRPAGALSRQNPAQGRVGVIAKITSGGSFRGVLDYLLNPKKEQQEGSSPARKNTGRSNCERPGVSRRRRLQGATEHGHETTKNREELRDTERQQKQPHIGGRDSHPEHARDLTDEYETGQRHRIIGGNLSGQNPRQLAREFGLVRELRPDIEKPVHHVSISAGKNDRLSVEQWQEIAGDYIEKMGFQNCPHIVIQHRGTERDHIHLVVSRIDEDGKVISEWQSKRRAEKVMREVEHKYNLEHVPMSREAIRATPTRAEREVFERTGRMSAKMSLQGHVERALRDQPTATEFIEKLQRIGVQAIPNLQSTGRVSGISFRQGEELMKGSDLGRGLSWEHSRSAA